MYRPKTYLRVMEFANALRTLLECVSPSWPNIEVAIQRPKTLLRTIARFDNLVERAYLVGHGEGFVEGKIEGIMEGKDEALCHHAKDEEWEHAL